MASCLCAENCHYREALLQKREREGENNQYQLNHFSFFHFSSKPLQTLAKALAPCYLRLGGTSADFLTFDPNGDGTERNDGLTDLQAWQDEEYNFDHLEDTIINFETKKHFKNFTLTGRF